MRPGLWEIMGQVSSCIEQHPLVECPVWFRYAPPGRTVYGAQSEPTPDVSKPRMLWVYSK